MKKYLISTILLACALTGFAQQAQKDTIAITKVSVGKSLPLKIAAENKGVVMGRVVEALSANLTNAFQKTRKFEVLTRTDLDAVNKEADLSASGNVAPESAVQTGKLKGAKYIVTVEVTDFQDYTEKARFESLNRTAEKRILRFGAVANVINSQTGAILETSSVNITDQDISDQLMSVSANGNLNDSLIAEISKLMADRLAQNISDTINPAKAMDFSRGVVTFNRGSGAGVKVGDIYEVFEMGNALIDPDTGENLGQNEIYLGTLIVTRVNQKFSQGTAKLEGSANANMMILRPQKTSVQAK